MALDVYSHHELPTLFRDAFQNPPGRKKALTLEQAAKILGYTSPRAVAMILKGDRSPSDESLQKFGRWLKLDKQASSFVDLLASRARTGDSAAAELLDHQIASFRENRFAPSPLPDAAFSYISEWHHFVVRELVGAPPPLPPSEDVARRLNGKVTPAQVEESWDLMFKLGILLKDAKGRVTLNSTHKDIETEPDRASAAVRRQQVQMMQRATEAMTERPPEEREMMALTLRTDPERMPEAKEFLRDFVREFYRRFNVEQTDRVYQLNVQCFEHTKS